MELFRSFKACLKGQRRQTLDPKDVSDQMFQRSSSLPSISSSASQFYVKDDDDDDDSNDGSLDNTLQMNGTVDSVNEIVGVKKKSNYVEGAFDLVQKERCAQVMENPRYFLQGNKV